MPRDLLTVLFLAITQQWTLQHVAFMMMVVGTIQSNTDNNVLFQEALDCIEKEVNHRCIQIHSYYDDIRNHRSPSIEF